ncbi:MAG: hypothetical protein JOY61_06245 [Chloroflexi bacterium]|nr:hypothetical protein [Chloroflexota bacterium]
MGEAPRRAAAATEGPHLASTPRRRNILLLVIFVPLIGVVFAWLNRDWPSWARVIATAWTIIVVLAAVGLGTDLFGPRNQNTTSRSAQLIVL